MRHFGRRAVVAAASLKRKLAGQPEDLWSPLGLKKSGDSAAPWNKSGAGGRLYLTHPCSLEGNMTCANCHLGQNIFSIFD